jgi:hypothetical protein
MALLCWLWIEPGFANQAGASDAEKRILAQFEARVQAYVTLHRSLERDVAVPVAAGDQAQIRRVADVLASRIRAARADAGRGDLFTPETAALFRRLIADACGGQFSDLRALVDDENPYAGRMEPRVNGSYPPDAPLPTMRPDVLCQLPELPYELQFRFMDNFLILLDTQANLIVDYMPDAIGRTPAS